MKNSNAQWLSNAALIFCLSLLMANQSPGESKEPSEPEFTASQPISNGFVFIEGKYIEAPYVVSRKGLKICINNETIVDYAPLVKDMPKLDKTRPVMPSDISTNAEPENPILGDYLYRMGNYLRSQHDKKEALIEMEKVLRELPCVKNVQRELNLDYATVEFANGRSISMGLLPFSRKPTITSDTVVEHVSRACRNYVERLGKGDFYSFSHGGSRIHTFGAGTAKGVMPNIVKVLRSSQDNEAKAKQLSEMLGMPEIPKEQAKTFVNNLSISKQLDDRAEALVKEDK